VSGRAIEDAYGYHVAHLYNHQHHRIYFLSFSHCLSEIEADRGKCIYKPYIKIHQNGSILLEAARSASKSHRAILSFTSQIEGDIEFAFPLISLFLARRTFHWVINTGPGQGTRKRTRRCHRDPHPNSFHRTDLSKMTWTWNTCVKCGHHSRHTLRPYPISATSDIRLWYLTGHRPGH
jgi:hypothetical protein